LGDIDVDVGIILKSILIGCEDIEWFNLAENRVKWWVLLNTVMSPWTP